MADRRPRDPAADLRWALLWEDAYASAFQIQVSNDNATWTSVYSTTTNTSKSQTLTVSATDRYVRVYATARATQWGDSILEFDVYGLTSTPPVTGGNGNGGNGVCPWVGSTAPVAQRVQQVLNTMNQSEELTLVAGDGTSNYIGHVAGIPNLCIPQINMEDGPSGVGDGTGGVTAFPDGESAAATWDPALIQQEGTAKGAEFAGKGVNVSLGPTTNLVRDPRWGRTYETYGEDPFLAGQITSAEVKGLQSQGVMADVKHVAAYDQEQYPTAGTTRSSARRRCRSCTWLRSRTRSRSPRRPRSCAPTRSSTAPRRAERSMLSNSLDNRRTTAATWSPTGAPRVQQWPTSTAAWTSPCRSTPRDQPGQRPGRRQFSQSTVNSIVARILTQLFGFGVFDNPAAVRCPRP